MKTKIDRKDYETASEASEDNPYYKTQNTNYPYTRYECAQLFKRKIYKNEEKISIEKTDEMIEKGFEKLKDYNYTVRRTTQILQLNYRDLDAKVKNMRRKVKLDFECVKCDKKFNSIVGTFQITYDVILYSKNKADVQFKPKIYTMQCSSCERICHGKIYQSQLDAVVKGFYLIISQIIERVKPPKFVDNRFKHDDVHDHIESLCEACKKGVCFARKKNQRKIIQNTNQSK